MFQRLKTMFRLAIHPPHAVILTYHSLLAETASFPVWQHLRQDLAAEHFKWLASNCNCISMRDLLSGLQAGRLPERAVVVSFDDGFANNLNVALPLLGKYNIPATFFISAGLIGTDRLMWPEAVACILESAQEGCIRIGDEELSLGGGADRQRTYKTMVRYLKGLPPAEREAKIDAIAVCAGLDPSTLGDSPLGRQLHMMTWKELAELSNSPLVSIGAHTMTHPQLTSLSDDDARHEIVASRQMLTERIGPVDYFAYPYGGAQDFSDTHRQMALDAGYSSMFTAVAECVFEGADRTALPRFGIGGEASVKYLDYAINGGLASVSGARRWTRRARDLA